MKKSNSPPTLWLSAAAGAGLAAALTAAEEGASVIILEKGAAYGGNTILSGGYYQAAHPDYLQYASLTDGQKEEIERYISLEPKDERMASWQAKVKEQYAEHLARGSRVSVRLPRTERSRPMTAAIISATAS